MKKTLTLVMLLAFMAVKAQDTTNAQKDIVIAYDSYDLVVRLKNAQQPLSEMDSLVYVRNVEHLKIMLSKHYFFNALTTEQKSQLQLITE
jgi:hypothetical protein